MNPYRELGIVPSRRPFAVSDVLRADEMYFATHPTDETVDMRISRDMMLDLQRDPTFQRIAVFRDANTFIGRVRLVVDR